MVYVLDTNIILNSPNLSAYRDKEVYIPIGVYKELDEQKTREGNVGFKSRLFYRNLKNCSDVDREYIDFKGVKIINPTSDLEKCSEDNIVKADDWFVGSKVLKKEGYVAHTSDFSLYTLMRTKKLNCEYIPQQTKEDFSKLNNVHKTLKVSSEEIDNFETIEIPKEFGCMDYVLLENKDNPKHTRLMKIRGGKLVKVETKIKAYGVKSKNLEQTILMDCLMDESVKAIILTGRQGTGKSYLSLACGLEQINSYAYNRILLAKSQAPLSKHEEIGWLTGDIENKLRFSMVNYMSNIESLHKGREVFTKDGVHHVNNGMAIYEELKSRGKIDFLPLDSILGASYDKTFILIDESQSLDFKTVRSCLTRISDTSKIVMMGDLAQQTDVMHSIDKSGLYIANQKLRNTEGVCVLSLSKIERGQVCENIATALDDIHIFE